jgi:hypothetical protein
MLFLIPPHWRFSAKNAGFYPANYLSEILNIKNLNVIIVLMIVLCSIANSQIFVTFAGDTTKVWDKDFELECCAKFKITSRIANDTLWISEIDTTEPCRCVCTYTNCISFIALPVGTYHALLYRQIKFISDTPSYIGSVTFAIVSPPILSSGILYYQSGCHNVPNHVADNPFLPQKYATITNYPNPFNPGTIIRYSVPHTGRVTLAIFNFSGQRVAMLVDEIKQPGTYELNYNTHNLSSGVYICRINFDGQILSSKLTLLK